MRPVRGHHQRPCGTVGKILAAVALLLPSGMPVLVAQGSLNPAADTARWLAATRADTTDPEAHWRAAVALVDLGTQTRNRELHARAVALARRAVVLAPEEAGAQFALALALGRHALTRGRRDRVRSAGEIRAHATRALALDPDHDGAHHVLGRWHAEIRRLSGIERFLARTALGGSVLGESSWDEALRHLERAVALRPDFIYHRLGLARVYVDLKRWEEARTQLETIPGLPTRDASDPAYRREAAALLERIRDQGAGRRG